MKLSTVDLRSVHSIKAHCHRIQVVRKMKAGLEERERRWQEEEEEEQGAETVGKQNADTRHEFDADDSHDGDKPTREIPEKGGQEGEAGCSLS